MKKIIEEISGGALILLGFIAVTIALIDSGVPQKYLFLYIIFEFMAFIVFSLYETILVATLATFIAVGTLVISGKWFSLAAIVFYWGIVLFFKMYIDGWTKEYGEQLLEIEDEEREIGELIVDKEKFSERIHSLKEKILKYEKISEFSLKLKTTFNLETIYAYALEYLRKCYPRDRVSLVGSPQDQYDNWVVENNKPLLIEYTGKDYRFMKNQAMEFNSLIECPVVQDSAITGAIRITCLEDTFYSSDLRILNVSAILTSIALEKAKLYKKTEELAITDSLTHLYTHSYFKERLEEEVHRSARYREKFVVLMIDIDNFKNLNDSYGHQAGDIVLKKTAKTIKDTVRETDIVGRYGGEEMSVILHNIETAEARIISEKIRQTIESQLFTLGNMHDRVTITIGAANFPDSPTGDELIRRADEALYKGKKEGKNKVVFA